MSRKPARKPPTPATDAADFGRLLTAREVAARLGLCVETIRRLVLRGALPSVKLGTRLGAPGGVHRIPERCVNEWIARNLTAAA